MSAVEDAESSLSWQVVLFAVLLLVSLSEFYNIKQEGRGRKVRISAAKNKHVPQMVDGFALRGTPLSLCHCHLAPFANACFKTFALRPEMRKKLRKR